MKYRVIFKAQRNGVGMVVVEFDSEDEAEMAIQVWRKQGNEMDHSAVRLYVEGWRS
jgi:hypothetical protein